MRNMVVLVVAAGITACGLWKSNLEQVSDHFSNVGSVNLSEEDEDWLATASREDIILQTIINESVSGEPRTFKLASFISADGDANKHIVGEVSAVPFMSKDGAKRETDDCLITWRDNPEQLQICVDGVIDRILQDCVDNMNTDECSEHCWLGDDANKCVGVAIR